MADLTLQFDVDPRTGSDDIAAELERSLKELRGIDDVRASADQTRFTGLEILAGITLSATYASQGFKLAEALRKLFSPIAEYAKKHGARARIPVGLKAKALEELTDDDYDKLAANVAERLAKRLAP